MTSAMPRGLHLPELLLIQRIEKEVGEVAAASVETAILKKNAGQTVKRLQGIDSGMLQMVLDIADQVGAELPARAI